MNELFWATVVSLGLIACIPLLSFGASCYHYLRHRWWLARQQWRWEKDIREHQRLLEKDLQERQRLLEDCVPYSNSDGYTLH